MTRWLVAWGPAAIWAAFLFFLSSRSTLVVELDSGIDKIAHFGAYLVLGLLLIFATVRLGISPAIAITLGLLYGFTDEVHQSFVPGRMADSGDWFADALGIVAGVLLFLLVRRARAPDRDDPLGPTAESTST